MRSSESVFDNFTLLNKSRWNILRKRFRVKSGSGRVCLKLLVDILLFWIASSLIFTCWPSPVVNPDLIIWFAGCTVGLVLLFFTASNALGSTLTSLFNPTLVKPENDGAGVADICFTAFSLISTVFPVPIFINPTKPPGLRSTGSGNKFFLALETNVCICDCRDNYSAIGSGGGLSLSSVSIDSFLSGVIDCLSESLLSWLNSNFSFQFNFDFLSWL